MRGRGLKESAGPTRLRLCRPATISSKATNSVKKHIKANRRSSSRLGGIGLVRAEFFGYKPPFRSWGRAMSRLHERTADVTKAVQDIWTGKKTFDNGTICASEQSVVRRCANEKGSEEQFKLQGGHFLSDAEAISWLKSWSHPQRSLNRESSAGLSESPDGGLNGPAARRCLDGRYAGVGRDFRSMEKLSRSLNFYGWMESGRAGARLF